MPKNNKATRPTGQSAADVFATFPALGVQARKAQMDKANATKKAGNITAAMVCGLTADGVQEHVVEIATYPKEGQAGANAERVEAMTVAGVNAVWEKPSDKGLVTDRKLQGAIKAHFLADLFGLSPVTRTGEKDKAVDAVWANFKTAELVAEAIHAEGMTATLDKKGALSLSGGSSDRAEAMRDAKTFAALLKIAKGEKGQSTGSTTGKGNVVKSDPKAVNGADDVREDNAHTIIAAMAHLVTAQVKESKKDGAFVALTEADAKNVDYILTTIAANPELFA